MGWKLLIPYIYGFNTRAKTTVHRLSFFALIVMPIYINVYFMSHGVVNNLLFVLGFTAMYVVYEIGYIYNDSYTAQKEAAPTQWLDTRYHDFLNDKFPIIISCRVLYAALLLYIMDRCAKTEILFFALLLALMNFFFSLHNYFRGKLNVFSDGMLQILKYISVLALFNSGGLFLRYSIYVILEIGVIRTVEYAIGRKYYFKRLWGIDIDRLRIIYYIALSVIAFILTLTDNNNAPLLVVSIYLLLYRTACKMLTKKETVAKSRAGQ